MKTPDKLSESLLEEISIRNILLPSVSYVTPKSSKMTFISAKREKYLFARLATPLPSVRNLKSLIFTRAHVLYKCVLHLVSTNYSLRSLLINLDLVQLFTNPSQLKGMGGRLWNAPLICWSKTGNALLIPGAYALFTQKMNLIILKKLGKEFSHYISIFYITADSFIVKWYFSWLMQKRQTNA
jgi:hypothetical protein